MAEVLIETAPTPGKAGRHLRVMAAQDLIIASKVAAAKAHMPNYLETIKRSESVAAKVNPSAAFENDHVKWKSVQDRYKRMQEHYGMQEDGDVRLSGVSGGEMGELADLRMAMREAKDDWEAQKNATKTSEQKKEEEKERMGQALI